MHHWWVTHDYPYLSVFLVFSLVGAGLEQEVLSLQWFDQWLCYAKSVVTLQWCECDTFFFTVFVRVGTRNLRTVMRVAMGAAEMQGSLLATSRTRGELGMLSVCSSTKLTKRRPNVYGGSCGQKLT